MSRAALISAIIIVLFGILVPLRKGADFLDPIILSGCLVLSLVIVAPAAASTFSGGEPAEGRPALRRLAIVVVYAWGMGVAVLAAGVVTINLHGAHHQPLAPRPGFVLAALAWSAAATAFVGAASALVSRRYSASAARNALRLVFLGLVLFLVVMSRFGGPNWLTSVHAWCTAAHLRMLFAITTVVLAGADALLGFVLVRGARPG